MINTHAIIAMELSALDLVAGRKKARSPPENLLMRGKTRLDLANDFVKTELEGLQAGCLVGFHGITPQHQGEQQAKREEGGTRAAACGKEGCGRS